MITCVWFHNKNFIKREDKNSKKRDTYKDSNFVELSHSGKKTPGIVLKYSLCERQRLSKIKHETLVQSRFKIFLGTREKSRHATAYMKNVPGSESTRKHDMFDTNFKKTVLTYKIENYDFTRPWDDEGRGNFEHFHVPWPKMKHRNDFSPDHPRFWQTDFAGRILKILNKKIESQKEGGKSEKLNKIGRTKENLAVWHRGKKWKR